MFVCGTYAGDTFLVKKFLVRGLGVSSFPRYMLFFRACDENGDGKFSFEDFEGYCTLQGEAVVNQTLKLLEVMFDGVVEDI